MFKLASIPSNSGQVADRVTRSSVLVTSLVPRTTLGLVTHRARVVNCLIKLPVERHRVAVDGPRAVVVVVVGKGKFMERTNMSGWFVPLFAWLAWSVETAPSWQSSSSDQASTAGVYLANASIPYPVSTRVAAAPYRPAPRSSSSSSWVVVLVPPKATNCCHRRVRCAPPSLGPRKGRVVVLVSRRATTTGLYLWAARLIRPRQVRTL